MCGNPVQGIAPHHRTTPLPFFAVRLEPVCTGIPPRRGGRYQEKTPQGSPGGFWSKFVTSRGVPNAGFMESRPSKRKTEDGDRPPASPGVSTKSTRKRTPLKKAKDPAEFKLVRDKLIEAHEMGRSPVKSREALQAALERVDDKGNSWPTNKITMALQRWRVKCAKLRPPASAMTGAAALAAEPESHSLGESDSRRESLGPRPVQLVTSPDGMHVAPRSPTTGSNPRGGRPKGAAKEAKMKQQRDQKDLLNAAAIEWSKELEERKKAKQQASRQRKTQTSMRASACASRLATPAPRRVLRQRRRELSKWRRRWLLEKQLPRRRRHWQCWTPRLTPPRARRSRWQTPRLPPLVAHDPHRRTDRDREQASNPTQGKPGHCRTTPHLPGPP